MCGIAGIVDLDSSPEDLRRRAEAMRAALRHRGPDDEGLYASAAGPAGAACCLVNTRLAVLDTSAAGHQPLTSPCGRYTIVFNGEIYNFRELRESLARGGPPFRSNSDTEVVLRLYEEHGPKSVTRLRGMFAFAIWDQQEQSCFVARDALGIKPLYLAAQGTRLAFASEVRAFLAADLCPRRLDADGLFGFLRTGSVPEPWTLLSGVRMLPAGSALLWRQGRAERSTWWSMQAQAPAGGGEAKAGVQRLRGALLDTIRHHFVSDVPVGIFLSGGIDSSALLALSGVAGFAKIKTFTLSFDEQRLNEGDLARRTASAFGAEHHDLRLQANNAHDLFERFLCAIDQPSIDGFNTFAVAHLARQHGIKVALSGLGGDELFAGYPSFTSIPRMLHISSRLGKVPMLRPAAAWVLSSRRNGRERRLADFLAGPPSLPRAYRSFRGIYSLAEARELAMRLTGFGAERFVDPPVPAGPEDTERASVGGLEIGLYMKNQLLRDSDVMSMASGLELRVPLVDQMLLETACALPDSLRLRDGKQLLLEAVPEIPEWIRSHPKKGFVLPYQRWFDHPAWNDLRGQARWSAGLDRPLSWYERMCTLVLSNWCRLHAIALP